MKMLIHSYQNCIIEHAEYVKEWEQALEDAGMKYRKAQKGTSNSPRS